MTPNKAPKSLIQLLKGSVDAYWNNPVILIPFLTIAFIQLLVLEILYFSPRFPLSMFFNPIVGTLWGFEFIRYPNNIALLPKLFQNVQVLIYLFISSFFICTAINIILNVNSGKKAEFGPACRSTISKYIHIFVAALITFGVYFGLYKVYDLSVGGVLKSSQIDGVFFYIKTLIQIGAPYINLGIGALATALFAFVYPAIIVDGKKVFGAIGQNFKYLFGSFWYIFTVILVPTLLFIPVIIIRTNIESIVSITVPELRVIALVLSVVFTMFIDATIYTAITSYYLLKKEHS